MGNQAVSFCKITGSCLFIYRLLSICLATNPDELQRLKLKGCHFHEMSRTKLTCSGVIHQMDFKRLWIVLSYLSCHYTMLGFYLENGNITNLTTNTFIHMKDLDDLSLRSSGIVNVDKGSFNGLKKLQTLSLIGNGIPELPLDLNVTLPKLRFLHVDNNKITRLYKSTFLGYPRDLEVLSLGYNEIKVIENGALNPLKKLKQIQLRGNRIKRITDKTFRFQSDVIILDLSFNIGIELKQGCFSSLTEMRTLNLRNCWPKGLPKDQQLFSAQGLEWTMIENLDIGHNKIDSLTNYDFKPFRSKLKNLDLEFCSLVKLEENIFAQFANAESIFLRNNRISEIANSAFLGMFSLQVINLERNNLLTINDNVFRVLNPRVRVALDGNPWSCSCMMRTLQSWLINNQPKLNITCTSPIELHGRNLKDVNPPSLYCTKPSIWKCCPVPITTTIGGKVFIDCAATGVPLPKLECFERQGDALPKNLTFVTNTFGETSSSVKIWINNVTTRNSGTFECLATSSQGQVSKECSIKVVGVTQPVKQKGNASNSRCSFIIFFAMFLVTNAIT